MTPSANSPSTPDESLTTALDYMMRGWSVIDVPYRSKNPGRDEWQKERLDQAELCKRFGKRPQNISVLLGEPSHGLVDIDLDSPEARALATSFLPQTASVFGRASSPKSHYLYYPASPISTQKFRDPLKKTGEPGAMLLEARSTGAQTVFPGSTHPSGEQVTWASAGEPARVDGRDLLKAASLLAAASLVARYWPGVGARQDASLALAGGLLRGGHDEPFVANFIRAVATLAGDEETLTRVAAAEYTRRRLEGGLDATGWPTLSDIIDERIVKKVMAWVGAPNARSGEKLSAALKEEASADRDGALNLPFKSAREVFMEGPVEVPWVVEAFVAEGALTEVDGKVKLSGKTTWLLYMCSAILNRVAFLGRKTCYTPIVFLTEQGPTAFKEALKRAGLDHREDLRVLFFKDVIGKPWEEVLAAATRECERVGAKLLIIDTLPQFAGIPGDGENSSGEALKAVRPLQEAAMSHDLAVVFTRHERKSGGEVGDAGRGSSAFAGASDVILALRRHEAKSVPNARVIRSLSRFEETPDELVIELAEGGYRVLGNERALTLYDTRRRLSESLPRSEEKAVELDDLVTMLGVPRSTLQEALKASVEDGEIRRVGAGKRNDAYRYFAA